VNNTGTKNGSVMK